MGLLLGGALLWRKYPAAAPVEVILPTPTPLAPEIYVGGEVSSPGFYPWRPGLTVEEALQAAGVPPDPSQPFQVKVLLSPKEPAPSSQKVNINTAPAYLLEALPGIGPGLAGAIIRYRQEHGPFRAIEELELVPRIGPALLKKVREFITVGE